MYPVATGVITLVFIVAISVLRVVGSPIRVLDD
jgi:hypothetical protein